MARPKYISDLHAAKYDLRSCAFNEKAQMLSAYKLALTAAANNAKCSEPALEGAVFEDFKEWMRQERLPKLMRPKASD